MTDKITLELTLDELKLIDKYVELNDETQSVFDKIKVAYPQTKSPVEEAYNECYGMYPRGDVYWEYFKDGYNAAQKDYKVGEFQETTQEPEELKTLYHFLAEWKYGIEEGDIIPQFDNDEFSVLDWSQIFIEYLYECGDIISEDKDEIVIKLKQTQLEIPND